MTNQKKWHSLQYVGLIIAIMGLSFVAFPGTLGLFSLRVITFIFLIISGIGITFSLSMKSKLSLIISVAILFMCLYSFVNPDYVLFLIGFALMLHGINGIFLYFTRKKQVTENAVVSSLVLILLGVFAILNAEAALSTVMMIFGILLTFLGVIIFISGKSFGFLRTFETTGFQTQTQQYPKKKRVVVNIQSDDVEEVDFKDIR